MAIITITGTPGSGKSTLAKLLAKTLGYTHYSMGDLQRKLATERGLSINELVSKNTAGQENTDEYIDDYQTTLGQREDNFVLDSRLGFHFLPKSIKLFVDADEDVRAQRSTQRTTVAEEHASVAEAKRRNRQRVADEKANFTKRYGVSPYDAQNYDLVLESTHDSPEALVRQVLDRFPDLAK